MEEERRSEEETSHHRPFQFLNEAIKSFMECLGLHISPPPYYSASSVIYYKFISKEAKENQVFQKEFYLLFYIDMTKLDEAPNGIATTRGMIVRLKQRGRETPSSGRPGRHN
ncbi:hypothetical protein HID58_089487 [Brassica napus]|uniref:Uncharacterized protein n=1 Tax=Brassica napus TaxID=3708 RepID=A0ABQ7XZ60_BRANA|nr:hypothetical protein HID58_089487 [Brassica napus]